MNRNYLYGTIVFLLILGCASTNTFHVENSLTRFSPSKKIYIEAGQEVVPLSSNLKKKLEIAHFQTADSRKDADYILIFNYAARFDVYPWVFKAFNLVMTEADTGKVEYRVIIDDMKPEPVHQLLTRVVDDMAARLLGPGKKGMALIIRAK